MFQRSNLVKLAIIAVVVLAAYFVNVEVQSYLGRQALAETELEFLSLDAAQAAALQDGSPILVNVSAIWCPSCRKLDQSVFADADVRSELARWKVVRLEYESDEGEAFLEQHEAAGFPRLFVLRPDGSLQKQLPVTFDAAVMVEQLRSQRGADSPAQTS